MYRFSLNFFPIRMWYTVVVSVVTILFNWKHVWQCTCELVVDNTVDSKDNMEEKTSEVADIRRYHFSWNYLQSGSDMQWWYRLISCLTFFRSFLLILKTFMTTLRTCKSMVVSTVDCEDSKHEKTREFADVRMYHFCWNFSSSMWYDVVIVVDMTRCSCFFVQHVC